jgi:catechol 2,3-dioxygenase-like lactoylglutathione lyase family enzyme
MASIEALVDGRAFQIAVVVRDLETALERYAAVLGGGPWRGYRFTADIHTSCEYRGGPTDFELRLALNDQSPQFELIEPGEGPSIHKDWLNERGEGLHHVGVIVESVPAAVTRMTQAGYAVIQAGAGFGAANDGAYAYFDAQDDLGLVLEVVEPPASMPEIDFVWPQDSERG